MALLDRRPTGLQRALLRAPIYLYRAHLGAMLGHRFVYLAHRGRTSGLRREVVLEVVRYNPRRPEITVVAAWGARSDWYRNIMVAPALEVRSGRDRWIEPRQRVLDPAERAAAFSDYARKHPRAWRALAPHLGLDADHPEATAALAADRFPAVAFAPRDSLAV